MAKECEMKLIGRTGSSFVARVEFVLKLKSIEYELLQQDLENKTELLLKTNPIFKRVPVLLHANEPPIVESLTIMEYLDEIQPDVHAILPSNPSERAQCRVVAYTFDTLYYPWMKEYMLIEDEKRKEELKTMVIQGMGMLEFAFVMLSKGKAFFGGDDIGYLDIVVGSFLGWFKLFRIFFDFDVIEETRTPRLSQWEKTMWSHEVTMSTIASHEIHVKWREMLLNRLKVCGTI
ncbi:hypothetical protein QVD17_32211 [Tagetes erecta]|uniref:Glutathione S-transferase n=1 Tax=Tagetes erecta TaxID=13708 RepID=A0AAD8K4T9_TARER|nr:hypothetical protein QVD17_32211 [Tagetes erecta]